MGESASGLCTAWRKDELSTVWSPRAMDMSRGYTLWEDFPSQPGEIVSYVGKCEKYIVTSPQIRFFVDEDLQKR